MSYDLFGLTAHGAGANFPVRPGRVEGAGGPPASGAPFDLPPTPKPPSFPKPRFTEGRNRLVGAVLDPPKPTLPNPPSGPRPVPPRP